MTFLSGVHSSYPVGTVNCVATLKEIVYPVKVTMEEYTDLFYAGITWENRLMHHWVHTVNVVENDPRCAL
jgi:hypothetical protein